MLKLWAGCLAKKLLGNVVAGRGTVFIISFPETTQQKGDNLRVSSGPLGIPGELCKQETPGFHSSLAPNHWYPFLSPCSVLHQPLPWLHCVMTWLGARLWCQKLPGMKFQLHEINTCVVPQYPHLLNINNGTQCMGWFGLQEVVDEVFRKTPGIY